MEISKTQQLVESDSPSAPELTTRHSSETPVSHPVLSRLIDEVRNEGLSEVGYDRVHNRHNRGR